MKHKQVDYTAQNEKENSILPKNKLNAIKTGT
jgi:hypothetical protein